MSHFLLSSCKTITSRPELLHMWQEIVPKDAVSQPFLMHGLLTFSALHLASIHIDDPPLRHQYAQLCQYHQAEAIPEFRQALATLGPESAGPCFAMGSILACLTVAAVSDNRLDSALGQPGSAAVTLDTILSIFTLIRGIGSILKPSWAWESFASSGYIPALHGHRADSMDYDTFRLPGPIEDEYVQFRDKISTMPEAKLSETHKTACLDALNKREQVEKDVMFFMRECGSAVQENTKGEGDSNKDKIEQSFLFKWIAMVPDEFVALLSARNPVALEILRGFVALTRLLRDVWYLEGFVENANAAIDGILGA